MMKNKPFKCKKLFKLNFKIYLANHFERIKVKRISRKGCCGNVTQLGMSNCMSYYMPLCVCVSVFH